jgi:tRNA nucleotidyltransferase (CCA-adding enzyme)
MMYKIENIPISSLAQKIIDRLLDNGWEAYLVGGCVRDALSGRIPKDFDLATNAQPEQIKALFRDMRIIETGIDYGTIILVQGAQRAEITTYRIEMEYRDGRRPSGVHYTLSLVQDLARRDFTINAIAYSPNTGLIDPFSGIEDLHKGLVRCVGNPYERLREDSLRILRAIRLISEWGYSIEGKTLSAMRRLKEHTAHIAAERIQAEFSRILCGPFVKTTLTSCWDFLIPFIPELQLPDEVLTHTIQVVSLVPDTIPMRLAALLHDIGKSCIAHRDYGNEEVVLSHAQVGEIIADKICKRMKYDNKTKRKVTWLVLFHDFRIEPTEQAVKHFLRSHSVEFFRALLCLERADALGLRDDEHFEYKKEQLSELDHLIAIEEKIIREGQCFLLKDLAIRGNDIKSMGIEQGSVIGDLLEECLTQVIEGALENRFEDLNNYVIIRSEGKVSHERTND